MTPPGPFAGSGANLGMCKTGPDVDKTADLWQNFTIIGPIIG